MPRMEFGGYFDLKPLDVPSWEVLHRVEQLFRQYFETAEEGVGIHLSFSAGDRRGSVTEDSIDELRAALDQQHRTPMNVRGYLELGGDDGSFRTAGVWIDDHCTGLTRSSSEEFADHVKVRLTEIFDDAHAEQGRLRREAQEEAVAAQGAALDGAPAGRQSFKSRFAEGVSIQAIGAVAGVIIVAVAIALWQLLT